MRKSSDEVPSELSHVSKDALEVYVRRRLLALAKMDCVAKSLNCHPDVICKALLQAMEMGHLEREDSDPSQPGAAEWQLVFRHDCLNQGCPDTACRICFENPNRRCKGNFADKYLENDVLKAVCGAPIRVEMINRTTGESASEQDCADVRLEMYILDGRAFAKLEELGQQHSEAAVDECMKLDNEKGSRDVQGRYLLATDKNGKHNERGMVLLDLHPTASRFPGLNVTASSEALLRGQKPPFRLLVRAMSRSTGARLSTIRFAVSEPFVVATQRTKTASKALVPSLSDPVGKLTGMGGMTVNKLADLEKTVRESKSVILSEFPLTSVSTVEEFRQLILWAEESPQRVEELKKVFRMNQNYGGAKEHAMSAVGKDGRMRFWTNFNDSNVGALFPANLGSIELSRPAALLEREGNVVWATLPNHLSCNQKEVLRRVQNQAGKHWWREGHPGWGIWGDMDEEDLHTSMRAQVGSEGCMKLPSTAFPEGVLNPVPRNTHSFGGFPSLSDKGSSGFMGLNALRNSSGGAFSRPNLIFGTGQPQLQVTHRPPAAGMAPAPWMQQPYGGGGALQGNMFMPSIPEPEQADLSQTQNGHGTLGEAHNSDLMPSLVNSFMPPASESLLGAPFRQARPPPQSPFADEEPQSSDGTATNSASWGNEHSSMRDKQPLLSQRESEGDRHRSKRPHVQARQLQQRMSALMGWPVEASDLRAMFPSISEQMPQQMPSSAFSGLPRAVSLGRPIQQAENIAQQDKREMQAPPVSTPPASAPTSATRQHSPQEGSAGVADQEVFLSQADIPQLDMDDFMNFLNNDSCELNPENADHLKTFFSRRLSGADDPSPSTVPSGSSRQGSALQSGFSYGQLLHSKGSEMGNSRPSSGLDNMSSLEEAMLGGTSKPQA